MLKIAPIIFVLQRIIELILASDDAFEKKLLQKLRDSFKYFLNLL